MDDTILNKCGLCLWLDHCNEDDMGNERCSHYSPIGEIEMDDEYIDCIIEDGRIEYRKEWAAYINKCGNGGDK